MTIVHFAERPKLLDRDICIIGTGPIGIALAMACEASGLSVLLLESGNLVSDSCSSFRSGAIIEAQTSHAAMEVAVCRALGGTSHWWGGRCVAFDDIDFVPRSQLSGAEWPLTHEEIKRWYDSSASFLGCGDSDISKNASAGYVFESDINFESTERWVRETNMAVAYRSDLERSESIQVVLGATVTKLRFAPGENRIESIVVADGAGAVSLGVETCVVACGGLETTRLFLVSQRERPEAFGGPDGPLGRYYMGHISGKLADVVFDDPNTVTACDFALDGGAYQRRRFLLEGSALEREKLLNIAFWIDNPPFHDPAHKSGILSLVWLMLATPFVGRRLLSEAIRRSHVGPRPYRFWDHARNVFCNPVDTVGTLARILCDRYLQTPRKPGFLIRNDAGRYALHYHAQQIANPCSRVRLSEQTDDLGVPRLQIEFKFCRRDAESVVRAHEILDEGLRIAKMGHLEYRVGGPDRVDYALQQATDGFHQIGTTKMGQSPTTSVVDPNCQVHGIDNLFVASTSVFPTSGQANPTFLGVALAFRLASYLSLRHLRRSAEPNRGALYA